METRSRLNNLLKNAVKWLRSRSVWWAVGGAFVVFLGWGLYLRGQGWVWADWTGFGSFTPPDPEYVRGKTLWDWLELLVIPVVLALGAFWLQRSERETDREIAEKAREAEQKIADNRAMDKILDDYLDRMTELLLERGLRDSREGDEVRDVARTRTLITLRRLDSERNSTVVQFLIKSMLVQGGVSVHGEGVEPPILSLEGADLEGTNLQGVNLQGANLQLANLQKAQLHRAKLRGANLRGANLKEAQLIGTNLEWANLVQAILQRASLKWAELIAANLEQADLQEADLYNANLQAANLLAAQLNDANLRNVNLNNADLKWAMMPDGEKFVEEMDLRKYTAPDVYRAKMEKEENERFGR